MTETALIFNIQHYSLHDGPGIRTVVFFKGCPLRCRWCSNPESQRFAPEISAYRDRCIGWDACGFCREVCDKTALQADPDGKVKVRFDICSGCQSCTDVCPSGALKAEGKYYDIGSIIRIVEQDQIFYARGNGGLTVSGGEPLSQPAALTALLREAKRRYLHTAMETCGCGDYEALREASSELDCLYYDIKSMDPKKHAAFTGRSNERILDNLARLCAENTKTQKVVRTPVIPGFNDTPREIAAIEAFAAKLPGNVCHELLPYHRFGVGKYAALGRKYEMSDAGFPSA